MPHDATRTSMITPLYHLQRQIAGVSCSLSSRYKIYKTHDKRKDIRRKSKQLHSLVRVSAK